MRVSEKAFQRKMVSVFLMFVTLFFVLSVSKAEAACVVTPDKATAYNNGETIAVTATNDAGGDWAVCIYSGGKVNGGENLPVSRSITDSGMTKTITAVVDTTTDLAGWKAVILPGNGCNGSSTTGALCETAITAAGTAAAADPAAAAAAAAAAGGTVAGGIDIVNPIEAPDFTTLIQNVLKWLLSVIGGIVLLFMIYGGLMYITSTGDQQKAEQGKKIVTSAVLGLIIIVMSYSILIVVQRIFFTI